MTPPSTRLLRMLLDSTSARVLARDAKGRVLFANRSAADLVGVRPKELVGRIDRDFYPPSSARQDRALDRMVLATGKSVEREISLFERTFLSLRRPLKDASGKPYGVGIVATDITARKKAELALRQSEELYRLFTENADGYSIFMLDAESRIISWNQRAQDARGITAREVIGRRYSDLFTKADIAKGVPSKLIARAERTGRAEYVGWELCRKGLRFWARVTLIALRDEGGNLRGFASITQDASESHRLHAHLDCSRRIMQAGEDERRRISKELHDGVGNILSSAKLTIHSLEKTQGKNEKSISETASRTAAIVGEAIKEVRRIIRNLRPPLLDDLGLVSALRDLTDVFKAETGARVRFHGAPPPARLSDELQLAVYRIAQEAIGNVIKHSGAHSLSVTMRGRKDRFILEVKDDGRGFRIPHRGRRRGADGMGLVNMKERAALIGGELEVASKPGRGTRVRLELPL